MFGKIRDNFICEILFFKSSLSISQKLLFFINKYLTIIKNERTIYYLNHYFHYDNRYTPALLQMYPHEIEFIDRHIGLSNVNSAIDIGANIGQWGYTLKSFFPLIHLYSFEPNSSIFHLLRKNSHFFSDWNIYKFGIGNVQNKFLYFSPQGSAEGSIYKKDGYMKTPITLISLTKNNRKDLSIPDYIDLVKIDVEGAEMEALHAIKDLRFKYLFIEISVKRKGGVKTEDIKKYFKGKAALLAIDAVSKNAPAANALFVIV